MRFAFAAALAAFLCAPAMAEDFGGVDLACVKTAAEKAEVLKWAAEHKFKVTHFDSATSRKIIAAINAHPPVTTLAADDFVAFRGENMTVLAFDIGKRFCMAPVPVPNDDFDDLVNGALGLGL